MAGQIDVSIVSHGHGDEVLGLLDLISTTAAGSIHRLILTLNIPEPALERVLQTRAWPYEVAVIRNADPKGFGANHNAAFQRASAPWFCVLNPDVQWQADPFPRLLEAAERPGAGCAYPDQVDLDGVLQDFARTLPTPWRLVERYALGKRVANLDRVEFVSGAFLVCDARAYRTIGGFDEAFFMYCEDVDFCIRLQLADWKLERAQTQVTHVGHHASRKNLRHMRWHIASLLRLWSSRSFWIFVLRSRRDRARGRS